MSTQRVSPIATAWRVPLKNPATTKKRRMMRKRRTWSHGALGNRKVQVALPCAIARGEPITFIWRWDKERMGERKQEIPLLSVPFLPINTFHHLPPPPQLHDLPIVVMCEPAASHIKSHLTTWTQQTVKHGSLKRSKSFTIDLLCWQMTLLASRWGFIGGGHREMLSYAPLRSQRNSDGQEKMRIKNPRVNRLDDAYQRWMWSSMDPAFN